MKSEARFIEDTSAVGLRWVGWADEIASLRHTGWFMDDDIQDEVMRGCVYALPSRKGRRVLVPAYREGNMSHRTRKWSDMSSGEDSGAAIVFLNDTTDDENDAARWADKNAERAAETEREYRAAWRDGNHYASLGDALKQDRAELRGVLLELRQERNRGVERPSLCAALHSHISAALASMDRARRERAELLARYDGAWAKDLREAFREGACI